MINSEHEAIMYITTNETFLLNQLDELEVKSIYKTEKIAIKTMKAGKNLLKINNYYGDKEISEVFIDMIDCKLF